MRSCTIRWVGIHHQIEHLFTGRLRKKRIELRGFLQLRTLEIALQLLRGSGPASRGAARFRFRQLRGGDQSARSLALSFSNRTSRNSGMVLMRKSSAEGHHVASLLQLGENAADSVSRRSARANTTRSAFPARARPTDRRASGSSAMFRSSRPSASGGDAGQHFRLARIFVLQPRALVDGVPQADFEADQPQHPRRIVVKGVIVNRPQFFAFDVADAVGGIDQQT